MTTNITTLAINLLISERKSHRAIVADRIIELTSEIKDVSGIDKVLKENFISIVLKCVEEPNSESRDVFYQLAQFYNQKLNGCHTKLDAAA